MELTSDRGDPAAAATAAGSAGARRGPVEGWFVYTIKQLETGLRDPLERVTQEVAGLTAAQYTALSVLVRWPGISSSELARRSLVRAQSMAQTMAPLLMLGYVERRTEEAVGRSIPLYLTDRGREVLDSLRGPVAEMESVLMREMSAEDRLRFEALLRTARSALAEFPR